MHYERSMRGIVSMGWYLLCVAIIDAFGSSSWVPTSDHLEKWGFRREEFRLLLALTSWATCGVRKPVCTEKDARNADEASHQNDDARLNDEDAEEEEQDHAQPSVEPTLLSTLRDMGWTPTEREQMGRACKRLLDYGRVLFLQERGFDARLVEYTDKAISLENVALVVRRVTTSP
jgi:tRNA:m4X modification enzyme